MSYAAVSDVQGKIILFTISATSKPTTAQVTTFITDCANEIDAALASRGLTVPVTAPAWFLTDLVRLNSEGAAAMTLQAAYPQASGPGHANAGQVMWDDYKKRVAELRKGLGIPVTAPQAENDQQPRSFFTDNNAVGSSSATDAWGDTIDSEPFFAREYKF